MVKVFRREEEILIGDGQDLRSLVKARGPQEGFLKQALAIGQRQEGLRVFLAGCGPEAATCPATNNYGIHHHP